MKKVLSLVLICILSLSFTVSLTGCFNNSSNEPEATPLPPDIDPSTVDVIGETWRVTELSFETEKVYITAKGEQTELEFFGEFTHKETGKTLTIPGFWDGDDTFKLRFSPTLYGVWEYKTICEADESLAGKTGTIGANAYKGDLELYRRGFVKTDPTKKYFIYDDGTPFFYLGDTHWNLLSEEYDSAGDHAGDIQTDSHFKYIVDKRVQQGFTVYQTQLETSKYNLYDCKVDRDDLNGFKTVDKYFEYIADSGFMHAHTQFGFSAAYAFKIKNKKTGLEDLARYWVARYGAYPVMWTLAQEVDNDYYYEKGQQSHTSFYDNIYVYIAECINKYDAYNHPLSGHQEGAGHTTVTGTSIPDPNSVSGQGASLFASEAVTERTGHDWWAAQWGFDYQEMTRSFRIASEYWHSNKVGVMYEGKYCYLWTKDYGARAQGYLAYLNGSFGYGYGAIDIWLYKSTYSTHAATSDGLEIVSVSDKFKHWSESIEFESAYQVGYMKQFLQSFNWWELVPDLATEKHFNPCVAGRYVCATLNGGNDMYVVYIYNNSVGTGYLAGMDKNATYTIKWFNPRTNEFSIIDEKAKATATDKWGEPGYILPNKPDRLDWVVVATKN